MIVIIVALIASNTIAWLTAFVAILFVRLVLKQRDDLRQQIHVVTLEHERIRSLLWASQ